MSQYIGSRISLISKSDIRYVGTLVEINSENSTVALDNVISHGTEDRRTGPGSIPPSTSLYEYILFRGSDVKDLRIEEAPKETPPPPPPQMPNDPAILGSARPAGPISSQEAKQSQQAPPPNFASHHPHYNRYGPYAGLPPPQAYGRSLPPGPGGLSGVMPVPGYPVYPQHFAPPPPPGTHAGTSHGWYPSPRSNFPPGQIPSTPAMAPPIAPGALDSSGPPSRTQLLNQAQSPVEKGGDVQTLSSLPAPKSIRRITAKNAPPPPVESKPDVAAALAPPANIKPDSSSALHKNKVAVPVVSQKKPATNATSKLTSEPATAKNTSQNTAQQATAAVAAAMAKLPGGSISAVTNAVIANAIGASDPAGTSILPTNGHSGLDNLTKKLSELQSNDSARQLRHYLNEDRGGYRGRGRGRGRGNHYNKIDIPTTDFDFEQANKKFNKEELAKKVKGVSSPGLTTQVNSSDALAHTADGTSSPAASTSNTAGDVIIPSIDIYDKSKSFFDNISSELKDRDEKRIGGPGGSSTGQEFRSEERRKNIETFGQGSVDGYRGGYRGRGRGRGWGRGGYGRGSHGSGTRARGYSRGRGGIGSAAAVSRTDLVPGPILSTVAAAGT